MDLVLLPGFARLERFVAAGRRRFSELARTMDDARLPLGVSVHTRALPRACAAAERAFPGRRPCGGRADSCPGDADAKVDRVCARTPSAVPATIASMAKSGRNAPCRCGSGRKAKRCCGVSRGPSEAELARVFLAGEALAASLRLAALDQPRFERLWQEMLELPARHLSLQFSLPRLVTPEMQRLIEAIRDDDDDEVEEALDAVLERLDSPDPRALLAQAVIDLRDSGRLEDRLGAVAILNLAGRSRALLGASILEAAAVAAGAARTPAGLLVADRLAA
jgi:hypothetical protein